MSQLVLELKEPSMPGLVVTVEGVLPEDMTAFRPETFEFVDADEWQIFEFTICGTPQLTRRIIATEFASAIRPGGCNTIQTRMTFAMKVIYQGSKAVPFRCVITGQGVQVDREDNPIISCTEKELAWATWQIARGRIDRPLGDMTPELEDTPEEKARFEAYWDKAASITWSSMRVMMEVTWDTAQSTLTFMRWWKSIVDAQPKVI